MARDRGRRKKLRRDRLELLRWRVATRLGFATVANLEEATTHDERAKLYALARLDGWGEEWQRLAMEIRRMMLRLAATSGGKVEEGEWPATERDVEYFRDWNDDEEADDSEAEQWAAAEQSLKRLAGL